MFKWTASAWLAHPGHQRVDGAYPGAAGRAALRVLRGGVLEGGPRGLQLAYGSFISPPSRSAFIGFRLARGPS